MDVGAFMELVVGHYYATRDPFGQAGDFTTAPEISQMFGELIGAWVAHQWISLGQPESFVLAEGGPGRGTLMTDIIRATKKVPGFHQAMNVVLLETSPILREKQKDALRDYQITWINSVKDIPADQPVVFIANELLDALPMRQKNTQGEERYLTLHHDDLQFNFNEDIVEYAPAREDFITQLAVILKKQQGAVLLIDYGYIGPAVGSTLQALKNHKFIDVLRDIGDADLTSHVDFAPLQKICTEAGLRVTLSEQGRFLNSLGLPVRAAKLKEGGARDIDAAVHRLTSSDEMGALFKVMEVSCL